MIAIGNYNAQDELDYAVLKVVNERTPAFPTLPPLKPIPIYKHTLAMEDVVKCYYAYEAPFFNGLSRPSCGIGVGSALKVTYVSPHHLEIYSQGFKEGSSGGPYIINDGGDGKVVAIHVDSSNDVPDLNGTTVQLADHSAEITQLRDAVSVLSHSHTSKTVGLIITQCTELVAFLRGLGIDA